MKKAIYKVPNGKLLKVFLEDAKGRIASVKITGDFFVYPEDVIEKLEVDLRGTELTEAALAARIHDFFEKNPCELFGVDEPSLVYTILQAHQTEVPHTAQEPA